MPINALKEQLLQLIEPVGRKDVVLSRSDAVAIKTMLQLCDAHPDTSDEVATMAGRYLGFQRTDLICAACDKAEAFNVAADVRTMAASLLRQVKAHDKVHAHAA